MNNLIEIGLGAIFQLPEPINNGIEYLNNPLFWANILPYDDAKKTYRLLMETGFPLVFHIYAENEQTANAEVLAIKKVLGDYADKARFEGGVGIKKLPFNAYCCVDDNVPYLHSSPAEMKAIVDRPYNNEMVCLDYRNVIKQMYRLKEPTQMTQLVSFMQNRKDVFIK